MKKAPAKPNKKAPVRRCGVSAAQFKKIARAFPGANEKPSYGKPSIFILKKFFTRLRAEDNSLVLFVGSVDERDMLLEAEPAVFHVTDHYKDYPIVLARSDKIDAARLQAMLERRWREIYPRKLLKALESA